MDAKQMAPQCRQIMAGESAPGGEAAGKRDQCGEMAAMCGPDDPGGMLKHCEQMAARFSGQDETADESEQSEPEGPQFA